jgi:hypothetical protein
MKFACPFTPSKSRPSGSTTRRHAAIPKGHDAQDIEAG